MTPLAARFRVYNPKRISTGFWDVMIFRTRDDLRAALRSRDMPGGAFKQCGDTLGFCRALTRLHRGGHYQPVKNGRRGLVMLTMDFMGAGVVAHEFVHAAHYELASHQKREPLRLKDDERLAYLVGELVKRYWRAYFRRFV